MLRIDPTLTSSNERPVPVSISAVKYDGQEQPLGREMKISSTVRKTEIHFSALNISTPERVLARYRLDGFDNDWVLQTTGRVATYPRLPPGKYVFHVMASNGYGEWDDAGTLLNLTVFPPWWQSTWAQLIYLFSLVIVVGVTVRISSHRRLRLRLQKLEQAQAIELERTRIARNIHDELGASLTHISLITQAAQHANPAQTDSFEKIYEATHEITRSMDEVVWAVNPKCDDLESLVYYVGNFAQRLLSVAGIRCRLDLPQKLPLLRLASPIRHNLFLCCKEALNNAVKHAQADLISIAITVNEAKLQIVITDNGRGLNPTGSPAEPDRNRLAAGSGLDNLRNRMAEVGGTCEFSTPLAGGLVVTFVIIIPSTS
jgi:signal transduction histidine kinase